MKGTAVENRNGKTAVLLEDGRIIIQNRMIPVGKAVDVSEPSPLFGPRRVLAACLCTVLMIVSLAAYQNYAWTALAYSTITVNNGVSIEYTLNRSGDVIAVTANDEASEETAEILNETSLNRKGTEAVKDYLSSISDDEEVHVHISSRKMKDEENLIHELDAVIDTAQRPNIHTGRHEPQMTETETAPPEQPMMNSPSQPLEAFQGMQVPEIGH